MNKLTKKQKETNSETWEHIHRVQSLLFLFIVELQKRGLEHDQSKLRSPEVEIFSTVPKVTEEVSYDSEEYQTMLDYLKPALEHHYANNRHHPQHWKSGIEDMTLVDIIEMLVDWKASSERYKGGNIRQSLQHNKERFNIDDQLYRIMENTVREMF